MKILQICLPQLSLLKMIFWISTLPQEIQKSHFQHAYFWLFMLSQKKTNCNPLAHPTCKCHHTNLWNCKTFFIWLKVCCVLSKVGGFEEPVVGCRRWLWKEPVVVCGNWNARQAMSQQVFIVTTFVIITCLQPFSTLVSRILHHAVLKFSQCRNKPLLQASTCPYQYMRSSCSVPQTQY